MQYIYATLLLHAAGKEINEANLKAVLEAAGIDGDEARIKALIASLKEVNIDEAIKASAFVPATPAQGATSTAHAEVKAEKKEEKKSEEEAVAGLGALFG